MYETRTENAGFKAVKEEESGFGYDLSFSSTWSSGAERPPRAIVCPRSPVCSDTQEKERENPNNLVPYTECNLINIWI